MKTVYIGTLFAFLLNFSCLNLPAKVEGLTVHDRILINANLFSRPARRLWAHKVFPRKFFSNSWWGKCHYDSEYSIQTTISDLGKLPKFEPLDVSACGRVAALPRIINGSVAERQTFKFTAAVMRQFPKRDIVICGSSVLSSRFLLTAAHCLKPFLSNFAQLKVSIGEYDLMVKDDKWRKIMTIDQAIIHKEYSDAELYHNDIGLIKTNGEIIFNDFVGPICLPPIAKRAEFFEEQAIVAGWGLTSEKRTSLSQVLLRTWVPVVTPENCWRELKREGDFFDGYLCAGGDDSSDSCQGDSGGPLVIIDHRSLRAVQIGIVSFSFLPVCGAGKPAIYTKLDQYTPWILENVEQMGGFHPK